MDVRVRPERNRPAAPEIGHPGQGNDVGGDDEREPLPHGEENARHGDGGAESDADQQDGGEHVPPPTLDVLGIHLRSEQLTANDPVQRHDEAAFQHCAQASTGRLRLSQPGPAALPAMPSLTL